jgi:predicted TIM-barrel fold metal-dependent hydrolase
MLEIRDHTTPDASPAAARHLFDTLRIERAVIVQPSVYGTDNRRQLDAMKDIGLDMRAVVVVTADISDRELSKLHELGVRGVRMIVGDRGVIPMSDLETIAARIKDMGWHIEFLIWPDQLVELESRIAKLSCPFVIDHLSFIDSRQGLDQPAFAALRRLAKAQSCWLKLSAANRLSPGTPPYPDLLPYARTLIEGGTERMVWGSDWPHSNFNGIMPNTTELLDVLFDWLPDAATRTRILVDNPARLYGFGDKP